MAKKSAKKAAPKKKAARKKAAKGLKKSVYFFGGGTADGDGSQKALLVVKAPTYPRCPSSVSPCLLA